MSDTPETNKFRASLDCMREVNQRDKLLFHARKLERERDEARRLVEKYRNLSCDDQDEADHTILPWEKQP